MPLKIIIGRSNSGKTRLMYQDIKGLEEKNKKCIVFVPDFARIVAEEEYFKYTERLAMINTKITTLKRYADQNIDKKSLYSEKEFLPEMSKKYIVKKCVIDSSDTFEVFGKVKNTQGFADKIYKYVSAFESGNIDETVVDEFKKRGSFLSRKFSEIYDIYEIIEKTTKDRFITSVDILDIFTRQTDEKSVVNGVNDYFFDYYNNFNEKELQYIYSLLATGKNVTVTLDLDMKNKDLSDIFFVSYDTYKKLVAIAMNAGVSMDEVVLENENNNGTMLEHLKQNIFVLGAPKRNTKDDTVELKLLKNPYEEIEYIAQDIAIKVKDKGYRYNDFKVYYNNPDMYDMCIERIFSEYNIPVYINHEGVTSTDSLVVFFKLLLKSLVSGFMGVNTDDIIQMLKTGLVPFDAEDIFTFENYILEFGIKLYNFTKPFEKNNKQGINQAVVYDMVKINEIREYVYNLISDLKTKLENTSDTKVYAEVLYDFLQSSGVLKAYQMQIEQIKEFDLDEFNKKKQIVQNIYEIMDNIAVAFDSLDLETYVELYIYGLDNVKLKSIPPYIDQVEVGDIDSTRSVPRKVVYIIGVYENGLPIISNTEGIFSDKEIAELEELGIEIEKTTEIRNNMALFNVYKAVNSCEEKLIFTMPASRLTGENLRVSPVITRVKDAINIELEGNVSVQNVKKILCTKNIYEEFVDNLSKNEEEGAKIKEEMGLHYATLMQSEKYANVLNYTRNAKRLEEKTVQRLYAKDINSSVSKLERFKACPFNYFVNYVLRLKEKKEYKLSVLDLGSIMHKVLEDFSKFLLANNKGFEDVLSDEQVMKLAKDEINKSIDDIFDNIYEKYSSSARYAHLKNKLKKGMLNVVMYISKSFSQSEFRPLGFEIEFDNNKLFAPIEVELSSGNKMYLRGKIDRVDIAKAKEATYLRVVDYKSSGKDLKLSDVKEGVSLQLMTYMAALLENKEKIDDKNAVLPAAVSYFTLNTDILNLSECVDSDKISEALVEKMKMKGIYLNNVEVLKKLDNNFSTPATSYLDITSKRLNNENKALNEERFLEECANMKNILKEIADEVVTGNVLPSKKEKSCKYCSYAGICKKTLKSMWHCLHNIDI